MSTHQFSAIPTIDIPRSRFDRTHRHTTAFDSGYLVPLYWDEIIPGDTFTISNKLFGRLTTPVVPFMDNLYLETFYFFVPSRLLWDHFVNMMGEQRNPSDSIDYIFPTINSGENGFPVGSLFDYFGVPTGVPNLSVNSMPFRAYNLIWNEWFRDENLQESTWFDPTSDGPDVLDNYQLLRRNKTKADYFRSCLPWPQKGQAVSVPLGLTAPVIGNGTTIGLTNGTDNVGLVLRSEGDGSRPFVSSKDNYGSPVGSALIHTPGTTGKTYGLSTDPDTSGMVADLSEATAADINTLREAFQIQRLLEASARSGSRYVELLKGVFRTDPGDARLQRPEYLGGTSTRMQITSVPQTASTDATSPQGNLAAYGTVGDSGFVCTKSFVEHGYVIALVNVRADLSYQQGLNRMLSKSTRWDLYYPQLAHLGEQAVLNKEIFAQGADVVGVDGVNPADDDVFGYQERYAEYRYYPNQITGKMRSTDPQSLDVWHLSQAFDSLPTLSSEFIEENPPLERVLAVQDEPQIKLDADIILDCARPMPLYSVPGLIDHF